MVDTRADRGTLKKHLKGLGISSVDEYQNWCRNRGIGSGLQKSKVQMEKERNLAKRVNGEAALASTRRFTRRPQNTIARLYKGEVQKGELGAGYLRKIRAVFSDYESDGRVRRALYELLIHVERYGDLFTTEQVIPRFGPVKGNTFIESFGILAKCHQEWIRPLEAWRPSSHNPKRQFSSLVRHLLARYDVPVFMDAAWFRGDNPEARVQRGWFLHVGMGENIRTADIRVNLTKRMAHNFLGAPDDLSVEKALRWAQVTGQGGTDQLARTICDTRLGVNYDHEEFWETIVKFLVNNPMLDPTCVGPIVDFIHNQKYEPEEIICPGGRAELRDPPQPNFSIKARSVDKLLQQVDQWHNDLAQQIIAHEENGRPIRAGKKRLVLWDPSGLGGFSHLEGKKETGLRRTWTIQELLSNRELAAEAKAMHHCVSSYSKNCRKGNTSIWSMQMTDADRNRHQVLTIAVDARARNITQVRGKYNALPNGKSRYKNQEKMGHAYHRMLQKSGDILRRWMTQAELTTTCQI